MKEQRIIIKTDDGRYVKAGNISPSEFTKTVFGAKFFKNEDDAKRCVAGGYRWLEKYGRAFGGNWPAEFKIVKVEITEVL